MTHQYIDKLHIENVQKVRLAFSYLYLLHKWLKENLNGNSWIFANNIREVSKHKLSNVELLMIFDEEKGDLFVYNRSIGVSFAGEFIKKVEKQLKESVSHDLA